VYIYLYWSQIDNDTYNIRYENDRAWRKQKVLVTHRRWRAAPRKIDNDTRKMAMITLGADGYDYA